MLRGAVESVATVAALARRWYPGRADAAWSPRAAGETAALFHEVGLGGPFWRLGATA